ncbi:MAG: amidohydrolase family protein [Sphingomonadaceae bacterium]|nr:amidohydrolase family protein [Sphingomonadaceae bacterium]
MHDLVIRGGTLVDGTGRAPRMANIAVDDGVIAVVGDVAAKGRQEIDAAGMIVTPGFIDLHTHYDAQVMWDPVLAPTAWHGVTTVVMGNCSVGLAPLRREDRHFPLSVMEAIEEIPREVMEEGIEWSWESYSEYLDALEQRSHTLDVATQVAHIALRAYVMGDRAAANEPATDEDMAEMERLAEEALRAGALGISGSRTKAHHYPDGGRVPGTLANEHELLGLADALGRVRGGQSMQYLGNPFDLDNDLPFIKEMAVRSQSPMQYIMSENDWQRRFAMIEQSVDEGLEFYGHIPPRGVGMVGHWRCVEYPFSVAAPMRAIEDLRWEERLEQLRDPDVKARAIAETKEADRGFFKAHSFDRMFEVTDYPDYEPDPETDSIAAKAQAAGRDPYEVVYDIMMGNGGTGMVYATVVNYRHGDHDLTRQLIQHPRAVVSLSDGGAHTTRVCDAAQTTFMLAHWARDRTRGEKLPLETVVQYLSRDAAFAYGLKDRGVIHEGYLADLNIIDFEKLRLPAPYVANDFPGGAHRLLQKAEGYEATIKRGIVTFRKGEHCGAFPGQIVRGPQMAPENLEAAD